MLTNPRSDRVKAVRALSRRSVRSRTGEFLAEGPAGGPRGGRVPARARPRRLRDARGCRPTRPPSSRPPTRRELWVHEVSARGARRDVRHGVPAGDRRGVPGRSTSRCEAALADLPPDALRVRPDERARPRQRRHGDPRRRRGRGRRRHRQRCERRRLQQQGRPLDGRLPLAPAGQPRRVRPRDPRRPARPGHRGCSPPTARARRCSTTPTSVPARLGHGQRGLGPAAGGARRVRRRRPRPDPRPRGVAQPRDGRDDLPLRVRRGTPHEAADRAAAARP